MNDEQGAGPPIVVTPEQLRTAFRVWMLVLPSRLWRKHEQFLKMKADRRSIPEHSQDPRLDLADYMARKFIQAGWEASHPDRSPGIDRTSPAGSSHDDSA
jgi:hypothetical protein